MAFELKVNEPVSDGITRNVKNQIEKALRYLGAKAEASGETASEKDAIGEVRKCFKRVRAALRPVREELGDDLYHEENWFFRDAARPLTQVRDAVVLVETADRLRQQLVRTIGRGIYEKPERRKSPRMAQADQVSLASTAAAGGYLDRCRKGFRRSRSPTRHEVERQAFAPGEEIYKDSPGIFTGRIKVLMCHEEAA